MNRVGIAPQAISGVVPGQRLRHSRQGHEHDADQKDMLTPVSEESSVTNHIIAFGIELLGIKMFMFYNRC